jgi:uncharacterized membrane protein
VLASEEPRLVTNPFRKVPVGTNGGISLAGCFFSALGGWIVSVSYAIGNAIFCQSDHFLQSCSMHLQLMIFATIFGLIGSLIDSLLGATLQFSGYNRDRKVSVQRPGPSVERVAGWNLLSNNQVNLISSLITSVLAISIVPTLMF